MGAHRRGRMMGAMDRGAVKRWSARTLAAAAAFVAFAANAAGPAPDPTATPVLVELFTSETCAKCVPADSVLVLIESTQPVDGARVIPITWHVSVSPTSPPAWVDPFIATFSDDRQHEYAASLERSKVYTPQAIIDGGGDIPGYNYTRICRAIARAADLPKPFAVSLTGAPAGNDSVAFTILVTPQGTPPAGATPPAPAEITLALIEDGLVSRVTAGQNAGRTLKHDRVARQLVLAARLDARDLGAARTVTARIAIPRDADRARLTAVAIVQETRSRRVIGVAERALR